MLLAQAGQRAAPPIPSTVACSHSATSYARVRRRMTRPALDRLDRPIQRRQIQLLDGPPHQAIRRKEIVPTDRPERHLSPLRRSQAKPPDALTLRRHLLRKVAKRLGRDHAAPASKERLTVQTLLNPEPDDSAQMSHRL
jgi:hypothetical protein